MAQVAKLRGVPRLPSARIVNDGRLGTVLHRAWAVRWRNPDISYRYGSQAYNASKQIRSQNRHRFIGKAARVLGWHARWKGEFALAQRYFQEAEERLASSDCRYAQVEAMAGRSVVLYSQGKQDDASDLIRKALTLLGHDGAAATRVDLFVVQATIISYSGAFDDALSLVQEAIQLAKKTGALLELSQAMHIKARILMRKGSHQAAMEPAQEAVALASEYRNQVVLPYANEVLAAAHLAAGNFKEAKQFAEKAIVQGKARGDMRVVCQSLEVLGRAERKSNNSDIALDIQQDGLAIAKQIDYPLWQRLFQLEIADILEEDGHFREALEAYKSYSELDQDLFRRETETRMAEMHTKFDLLRARELAEVERARAEELAEARQTAETAVRTDGLTKIANREGLDQFIEANALLTSNRPFTYVVVDLDRFKPINDTFGHAAGDAVLIETAARLKNVLQHEDLVARIGGDEFALCVTTSDTIDGPHLLGERLVSVFDDPVTFEGRDLEISASIGIATSNIATRDIDRLMSSADQAMYAAKAERYTSFRVFAREKYGEVLNLNTMEAVRQAIRDGQIQPWYQPKVNIQSGEVIGFEALARWVKPDGAVIYPSSFLPIIKQHNLQTEFTFSILTQALDQLAVWSRLSGPTPRIAINMVEELLASPVACEDVVTLLERFNPLAELVTFEITEDIFLDRGLQAIQASIKMLTESGVQFSMDDFGTGYGSFLHLRSLSIHELKLDIAFVQGIGKDRSAEVIIEGFVSIARGLGLDITAEGIETEQQATFLTRRGCQVGQGFLYSPALPSDLATAFLGNPHARVSA